MDTNPPEAYDFFISYANADHEWAEWIAWQLEAEGYTTFLVHRDVRPGNHWVATTQSAMASAKRMIAVISSAYFPSSAARNEWRIASQRDPTGERGLIIPVIVAQTDLPASLHNRAHVQLVGQDPAKARAILINGVMERGAQPVREPRFPGEMLELVEKGGRNAVAAVSRRPKNPIRKVATSRTRPPSKEPEMTSKSVNISKPRLFIGSSSEGISLAEYLQLNLHYSVYCTIWSQGVFGLSRGTLEALVDKARDFDYAALVLTPDDLQIKRGVAGNSPRDNVLFELGFFMGALGRDKTFIVYCQDEPIELPTDLAGVTAATFPERPDGNWQAALGPVATQIKREMGI
jgi:predicted nucleotide-binding protein